MSVIDRDERAVSPDTFEHAVFFAYQACDNLNGMSLPVLAEKQRRRLLAQLNNSAANLLRLQNKLINTRLSTPV
jgi:hypothetical protein